MKRSIWLAAAMCLMMGLGATAAKKNVVLIVTDDQGVDSLGCYGNPVIKTPNMDALAADGTRFQWAFATTASCSASRSVILTGLHNADLERLAEDGSQLRRLRDGSDGEEDKRRRNGDDQVDDPRPFSRQLR